MNIVLDSNVLFSALIKHSTTRRIILDYNGFFLFPEFIFEEMEKHKEELFRKSGMSEQDFKKLLQLILDKVVVAPKEILNIYKTKALTIVQDIDEDDVLFIACALAYPNAIIWSDDKKLKKQTRVKVLNTPEIMSLFCKKM